MPDLDLFNAMVKYSLLDSRCLDVYELCQFLCNDVLFLKIINVVVSTT